MKNILAFPGLGLEFSLSRELFSIGPLTVYWYGVIVVAGIALGAAWALYRGKQFGLDTERLFDVIFYCVAAGVAGARIYYVVFAWEEYRDDLLGIFRIWEGGLAFYGAVIGALLCAVLLCRRWKIPVLTGTDAALGGLLLGQSIGRWGNFVNIEAFGGYFTGPWRMVSPQIDAYFHAAPQFLEGFSPAEVLAMQNIPVHPTFFYESVWTLAGFLFLLWATPRRKFTGELTLFYFFWNGLGRAFIEGLRSDSLMFGGVKISQLLAALMVLAAAALWLAARARLKEGRLPARFALAQTLPGAAIGAMPAPDAEKSALPSPKSEEEDHADSPHS